ncbi:uncharacterized protein LOC106882773 [Octopus bimaculoides]|uniref:TNF family profile domain-containing protein n=1 Tax=Octopus bimaculoides TaxID=37653 RepID=A0A0L8FKF9_OCTBM|nr:uncharacterized protein LOC106882773 [Octopus bimaculoides]|eukprot:XP_014789043.1 PREDICTED: uncharacterized protein LOC106882773 [Octopus bimaculoides]
MLLKKHIQAIYSNNASDNHRYFFVSLIVLLAWLGYLQWYVINLSDRLQQLKIQDKVQPVYEVIMNHNNNIAENTSRSVEIQQQNITQAKPHMRFRRNKKKRCSRYTCQELKDYINEQVFREAIYIRGKNQPGNNGFFRWDPSSIGTQSKIVYNENGTLTFQKNGKFLIMSQIIVKGQSEFQNLFYGYETKLIKSTGATEILMSSYITQENRGNIIILLHSEKHAVDTLSHSVIHHINKSDQIAIAKSPQNSKVDYTQNQNAAYLSIVELEDDNN